MNIGRSISIALAQRDRDNVWLAKQMKVTRQRISELRKAKHTRSDVIARLARSFKLKPSEFVALGEEKVK